MKFTLVGSEGFIGSHLQQWLRDQRVDYDPVGRNDPSIFSRNLRHVIYCAGVTADFRQRPQETVDAHVCFASRVLREARWESFLYLSSTRIYTGATDSSEDRPLVLDPVNSGDVYNASKIMGETLCLSTGRSNAKVVRLSNVVGCNYSSDDFLPSIVREAIERGRVMFNTTLDSEKDYIAVEDVVKLLPQIAISGRHRVYNLASGRNTTNRALANLLSEKTGCSIEVAANARTVGFPLIATSRVQHEFPFAPRPLAESLDEILNGYTQWKTNAIR
jgi:nucleoside-diphosphate-sugar epimerase